MNRRNWFQWSAALSAMSLGSAAGANTQPLRPSPSQHIQVEAVQMPAWVVTPDGRRPIEPGAQISSAQEIQTAEGAALAMRLPEGSVVRLGEATRLAVERLSVDPSTGRTALNSRMRLFDGFFRFATSAVAKVAGERRIEVQLRTATIGIRGTDFWSMTDAEHDAACLFEGNISLATRDQGELSLAQPTAFWARFFNQAPRAVGVATPQELQKFLASTEMQPGRGVAVLGGRWRVVAATLRSQDAATSLMQSLREQGYPAVLKRKDQAGQSVHEVRINALATREDAQHVLDRISAQPGVRGRVALAA
jgi:hypothetical protein